jgi:site-specific DNA-methyltransferase (adenine-specific)
LNGLNSSSVDLIYLDPPFNSKRIYSAPIGSKAAGTSFKDMWTWQDVNESYLDTLSANYPTLTKFIASIGKIHSKAMMAYLTYMAQRIIEMHRILKDTGSLYLHCDPTASHYLKVLLDEIFGKNNFVAEIVWHYSWGSRTAKRWNGKHDVIFHYSKTKNYTFNVDNVLDERILKDVSKKRLEYKGAMIMKNAYTKTDPNFILPSDVWYIPTINAMSKERTGYPTQKPLALLHRIIQASSNEGDIVLDPFCGCATTCVAAQQLGRKWIGIDIEKQASGILVERLSDDAGLFKDFINTTNIPQRTDIQIVAPTQSVKERLYKEQNGLCNACGNEFEIRNLEIDHIIPKAKGGGDYYENYQLLCGSCNRIKGDRPMEYLRTKIEARERLMKDKIIFGE